MAGRWPRETSPPGVLVLATAFRAGPWACRSLNRAGYRVVGAHDEGRLTGGRSLACPRPARYPAPSRDPDGFIAAVREICRRERIAVVLPASEETARVLALRAPDLAGAVIAGPTREAYAALCDKARLAASAARAGVDHPVTVEVGPDGPEGPLPAPPCVVKPRVSGERLGGVPAASAAATAAERDAAVARLVAAGHRAVVQEHLSGPRWVAQSVRDAGGRLDLVASSVERDHPPGAGVASLMRIVPEAPAPLREAVAALLGLVDHRGPSTISFIVRDGRWMVHDVNLRLGSSVGVVMRGGLDMPRRTVEVALGLPAGPPVVARPYVYARLDGEVAGIVDALRGAGAGAPASRIAGDLAGALIRPGAMVDPHPLEPFLVARTAALAGVRLTRRGARALGRRRPRG